MRVLAVHADLIVVISRFWQTTCTAVRAGEEGFVIDSPIYPDELETVTKPSSPARIAVQVVCQSRLTKTMRSAWTLSTRTVTRDPAQPYDTPSSFIASRRSLASASGFF